MKSTKLASAIQSETLFAGSTRFTWLMCVFVFTELKRASNRQRLHQKLPHREMKWNIFLSSMNFTYSLGLVIAAIWSAVMRRLHISTVTVRHSLLNMWTLIVRCCELWVVCLRRKCHCKLMTSTKHRKRLVCVWRVITLRICFSILIIASGDSYKYSHISLRRLCHCDKWLNYDR